MPELQGQELGQAMEGLKSCISMGFSGGQPAASFLSQGFGAAGLSVAAENTATTDFANQGPKGLDL